MISPSTIYGWRGPFRSDAKILRDLASDKEILENFVDLAVVNSFILYKTITNKKISYQQFRKKLLQELCLTTLDTAAIPWSGGRPAGDITTKHYMVRCGGNPNCVYCKFTHGKRSRTTRICVTCGIPLCFTGDKDCFEKYHHRNFQRHRELIAKKYQRRTQVKRTKLGRPTGSVKKKGRGKQKKLNW